MNLTVNTSYLTENYLQVLRETESLLCDVGELHVFVLNNLININSSVLKILTCYLICVHMAASVDIRLFT